MELKLQQINSETPFQGSYELSFTHLPCSLGFCSEGYIPIGGLLLLQVAEGIGFEDWSRCYHRFRNICRLKKQTQASALVILALDLDFAHISIIVPETCKIIQATKD